MISIVAGCARTNSQESSSSITEEKPPQEARDATPSDISSEPVQADKDSVTDIAQPADATANDNPRPLTGSASKPNDTLEANGSVPPGEALRAARQLSAKGEKLRDRGRISEAYQVTLAAWEQLQEHGSDADCADFAEGLLQQLESLGEELTPAGSPIEPTGTKPYRFE